MMVMKWKRLHKEAQAPERQTPGSAGYDLCACIQEPVVPLQNYGKEPYAVQPGERVAQLIIVPVALPRLEEARELSSTQRGTGGFGSTGR